MVTVYPLRAALCGFIPIIHQIRLHIPLFPNLLTLQDRTVVPLCHFLRDDRLPALNRCRLFLLLHPKAG